MKNNVEIGKQGENLAKRYLISEGYNILYMNYKKKIGEIDIIVTKNGIIIFVEVKARTSLKYGYPYESVNKKKQQKIISTSMVYLKERNIKNTQLRYDIIEVYLEPNVKINHIENAFC